VDECKPLDGGEFADPWEEHDVSELNHGRGVLRIST